MTFKIIFGVLIFSCSFLTSLAQPTHAYTDIEKQFKSAEDLIQNRQYALAFPIVKSLKVDFPDYSKSSHNYLNDDIDYYYILCELKLMQPIGAEHAVSFIQTINNQPRKEQLAFHLAHYYFLQQNFEAAIEYFNKSTVYHLSNEDIADAKFEKAYALFHEKKFEEAKPLFNEIHQLNTNKYYTAANYYYGFICFYNQDYTEALTSFRTIEKDPEYNGVVPYYVAEILYTQDDKANALIYVDSVLAKNGGSYYKKELELINAQLYFEKKQYIQALPLFAAYADRNEKVSKEVMYQLSYCYYKNNDYSKAIEGFKQLSNEKDSMGQNSMYILGELYLKANDKANARTAFQFCAGNNSDAFQQRISRLNYAKLSYDLGYQDIALLETKSYIKDYSATKDESSVDPFAHVAEAKELLISLLANTNDYDEGLEVYQSLNQATSSTQKAYARLLYGKSIQLINEQKLSESVEYLNKILKITVATQVIPYANFWLGETAYRLRRYDDAVKFITIFINSNMPAQGEANVYNAKYTLAYAWFQKEQYKNALTYFEPIANTSKTTATSIEQDAAVRIADCYYMMKDFTKAASLYQNVIDKKYAQTDYALYQNAMIIGVKNNAEKIKALNALIKLYPSSTLALDAQLEIAQTYIADERYMDAVPSLNNIINSKEDESLKPRAYLKLGVAYYNNNDNKNALVAYRQLLKLYPQSPEAEEAFTIIKDIYVEEGNPDQYLELMRENGITVNVSEADSLSFTAAFNKYNNNDCSGAVKSFDNYLSKYAEGGFAIEATYYKAVCLQKQKDISAAILAFELVYKKGLSKFYDNATIELARMYYFENKDYNKSKLYFEALQNNSSNPEMKLDALRGLVRCYYQLKDFTTANSASKELLSLKGISADDKSIAQLVLAKSLQVTNQTDKAIEALKIVVSLNKASWGAEARYELAAIYLASDNLNVAEKYAMLVIKETGSYDEWVTKSYILLGDIFMKQKDYFNAKATFESVSKNAAIVALRDEAKTKLQQAIAEEKKSSKIGN